MELYELASFAILTILQVFGLLITGWQLLRASGDGAKSLILEKDGPLAGDVSFSRVAGVLGALTLTSLFVATVFWAHHALFNDGTLGKAKDLWPIYLFGTALFAPYAFNRLARLGQTTPAKEGDGQNPGEN